MPWEWLIFIFLGLLAGTIGSIAGLGGGIIIVPALLAIGTFFPDYQHITPQLAVGTSLLLIVISSLSSTLSYSKQKRVDFRSGLLFFISSGPGALIGAYGSGFVDERVFNIAFGLLMILVVILLSLNYQGKERTINWSIKREFTDPSGETHYYGYNRTSALLISFIVGAFAGFFGIGGGALMVPMMIILFRFPPHVATATSMFVMCLSAVTGSVSHLVQDNILWQAVLLIAPGAWLGGKLGAWISVRMSGRTLLIAFRVVIVLVAIRMITMG